MADDNFRSYRNRDPLPRDDAPRMPGEIDDPLAELARLIGQAEPYAEDRRSADDHAPADADAASAGWGAAEEEHAEEYARPEDRYVAPPPSSHAPYQAEQRDDHYHGDAPHYHSDAPPVAGRYFSGPASQFSGFREDEHDDGQSAHPPTRHAAPLPAYAGMAADDQDEPHEQAAHDDGSYAEDEYDDEPARPRRRAGVISVMAVFALVVVGSAAAFGYRAMFGGSVLPTLPPIIKASSGPNKIVPNNGEAQASNAGQAGSASAGSAEKLVSREEQPVNVEAQNAAPRVVSTIPIGTGQGAAPAVPVPPNSAPSSASSPWPNPPPAGAPWPAPPGTPGAAPGIGQPAPAMAQAAPQAAPPGAASAEPKRVHTVVIRSDQPGVPDAAPAASQQQQPQQSQQQAAPASGPPAATRRNAARSAPPKPVAATSPPPAGDSAPLSIVPGSQGETAPASAHARPMAVASAGPMSEMAASSSGAYAVQVTSQRSEAEAQSAFRELRAKFPNQLGGREPIIRRADLGAKGTYYRALVGPFASMEEAAEMCSGLKAAGGQCLVQRN